MGAIALLASGGLLQGNYTFAYDGIKIAPVYPVPGTRTNLMEFEIYRSMADCSRAKLKRMEHVQWNMLKKTWSGFCQSLSLRINDLNDKDTFLGLYDMKCWFISLGSINPEAACKYIKFVCDLLIQVGMGNTKELFESDIPDFYPGVCEGKINDPLGRFFRGELSHIAKRAYRLYNSREHYLPRPSYAEMCTICQIAVGKRASAHPSNKMIRSNIEDTITLLKEKPWIDPTVLNAYASALSLVTLHTGENFGSDEHISFNSSSRYDYSRSNMGSIAWAHKAMSKLTEWVEIESLEALSNVVDMFGRPIVTKEALKLTKLYINYDCFGFAIFPLIFFLYWKPNLTTNAEIDFIQVEERICDSQNGDIPSIGDVLLALCAHDMTHDGCFTHPITTICGIPTFPEAPGYAMLRPSPMRVSLSVESGLKLRLITASRTVWGVLSQPLRHACYKALRKDESLRIGFSENYKLWEFLKQNGKEKPSRIVSADLVEATYRMPSELLSRHESFYKKVIGDNSLMRIMSQYLISRKRKVEFSNETNSKYGPFEDFVSETGSHMGENLSFIDLTVMNKTVSIIADCYANFCRNKKIMLDFPTSYKEIIKIQYSGTKSQTCGDDHLALDHEDEYYSHFYKQIFSKINGKISPGKHGVSPYFGVFCENHFMVMTPEEMELEGVPENCRFGHLAYIDTVKGRLLNGVSKVQGKGTPCLGQGSALSTALSWTTGANRKLAYIYFWHQNFPIMKCTRGMNLYLPPNMGGYGLPMVNGHKAEISIMSESQISYLEYLKTISLLEDHGEVIKYMTLLQAIRSSTDKDVCLRIPQIEKLAMFKDNFITLDEAMAESPCPTELLLDSFSKKVLYLTYKGYTCLSDLNKEVERVESIRTIVHHGPKKAKNFGLSLREIRERFDDAWRIIKKELKPTLLSPTDTIENLSWALKSRYGSLFVRTAIIHQRMGVKGLAVHFV
jgi:hypothetical protein